MSNHPLVGVGLYTPIEAGHLIGVAPAKLSRWLRGHTVKGKLYEPLWKPQIDLGDQKTYLSFRDLLEARTASLFIKNGLSTQKIRAAIELASEVVGERPLSTTWLRTDGRTVFLRILEDDGREPHLIDLPKGQYTFNTIVEQGLKNVEFDGIAPKLWWPLGRKAGIVVDPSRAFGQPIEEKTSIPAQILANAVFAEGGVERAAKAWDAPILSVRRAFAFQRKLDQKQAA